MAKRSRIIAAGIAVLVLQASIGAAAPAPKDAKPEDSGLFGIIVDASGFKPGEFVDVVLASAEWHDWRLQYSTVLRNAEVVAVEPERSTGEKCRRYFVLLRVGAEAARPLKSATASGEISLQYHDWSAHNWHLGGRAGLLFDNLLISTDW
jgi:Flp pilus assembly protein CpaB